MHIFSPISFINWYHSKADIFAISLDDFKLCENLDLSHGYILELLKMKTEHEKALGTVEAIQTDRKWESSIMLGYSR